VVSSKAKGTATLSNNFEIIEENEDEEIAEEMKKVHEIIIDEKEIEQEKIDLANFTLHFKTLPLEETQKKKMYKFNAICHSFYVVKEKDLDINWKKPLI
jgi:hypothetical protein